MRRGRTPTRSRPVRLIAVRHQRTKRQGRDEEATIFRISKRVCKLGDCTTIEIVRSTNASLLPANPSNSDTKGQED